MISEIQEVRRSRGAGGVATFFFSPDSISVKPGETFTLTLYLNPTLEGLEQYRVSAFDTSITYPADMLSLASAEYGDIFQKQLKGDPGAISLKKLEINNPAGTVKIAMGTLCTTAAPWQCFTAQNTGVAATLRFTALPSSGRKTGTITLNPKDVAIAALGSDSNVVNFDKIPFVSIAIQSPSPSLSPTASPTAKPSPTATPTPITATPTPRATPTPTPRVTSTPTPTPTPPACTASCYQVYVSGNCLQGSPCKTTDQRFNPLPYVSFGINTSGCKALSVDTSTNQFAGSDTPNNTWVNASVIYPPQSGYSSGTWNFCNGSVCWTFNAGQTLYWRLRDPYTNQVKAICSPFNAPGTTASVPQAPKLGFFPTLSNVLGASTGRNFFEDAFLVIKSFVGIN